MALPSPEEFIKDPSWGGLSLTDKQRIAQRWRQEAYKEVISSDGFDYSQLDAIEDKALPKFGIEEDIFDAMGKGVDAFNATIQRWVPQEAIQDSLAAKNEMDRFQAELDRASADVNENAKKYNRPVSEDETDYLKQLYSKVNEATDKFSKSQIKAESFIGGQLTAARKDVQPHSMQIFNALPDNDAGALKWFFSSPSRGSAFIAASLASTMPDLAKVGVASLVGGPAAGGLAGGLSEYSASLYQKLQEEAKGDPAVMAQLLSDDGFISKIKGEAGAKGAVITAIDTATLKVGGVIGKKLINEATSKAKRFGIGALGAVAGGTMEGVGEMASAVAANDPVSIKEGIQEAIPGFVMGGAGVVAESFANPEVDYASIPTGVEVPETPGVRNADGSVAVDLEGNPVEADGIPVARPVQEPFVKKRNIRLPNGKIIEQTVPINRPQPIVDRVLTAKQLNDQKSLLGQLTNDTEPARVAPIDQLTGDPAVDAAPTVDGGFEGLTNDTEAKTPSPTDQLDSLSRDTELKTGVRRTPEQVAYFRSNKLLNNLSNDTEAAVSEIINDPVITPDASVSTKAAKRQEVIGIVAQETGASKLDAAKKVAAMEAVPEPVFEDESPLDGVEKAYADGIIPDSLITEDDPTDDLLTELEGFRDVKYGEGNEEAEKAANDLLAHYESSKKASEPTTPVVTPLAPTTPPKGEALTGPDGKPETSEARKQRIADTIAAFSALDGEAETATPKPNLDDIQSLNEAEIDGALTPAIIAELESGSQDLSPEAAEFVDDNSINIDSIKETLAEWQKRNPKAAKQEAAKNDVFAPTKFESRETRIERAQALDNRLKWGEDIYSEARDEARKSEEENGGVPTARLLDISREITNRGYEDEYGIVPLIEAVAKARKDATLPPELITEFPTPEIVTELESIRYAEDDVQSDRARVLLDAYASVLPLYEREGYGKGTLPNQIFVQQLAAYDDNERTTIRGTFGVSEYDLSKALIEERDKALEAKWAAEDADKKIATIKAEADQFKKLAGKGYGKAGIPNKYFGESTNELVEQLDSLIGSKEDAYQNYIEKANPDVNVEGAREQEISMLQDLLDAHNANLSTTTKPKAEPIPKATVVEDEQDYSGDWGDDDFADADFYEGTLEDLGDTRVDVSDFSEAYNDRARDRFGEGPGAAGVNAPLASSYPDPLDVGVANSPEGEATATKVKATLRAEQSWAQRTVQSIKDLKNTRLNRKAARQAKEKAVTTIVNQFRPLDTLVASVYERSQAALKGLKDNMISRIFEQVAGASGKAMADVHRFDEAITKGLPKELWQHLNEYIFLFRAYDRLSTAMIPGLNKRGIAGYTAQGAADALARMEAKLGADAFSKIEAAASVYQSFGNKALDLQVTSGRLSAEDARRIKALNDFYAPFKVLSHIEKQETHAMDGKAIDSKQPLFKMITGITKDDFQIKNPIQAMRENIYRSRVLAEKNLAMQELAKVATIKPRNQEAIIAAKLYVDHQNRVKKATDAGDVAAVTALQDEFEDAIVPDLIANGLPDPSLPKQASLFVVGADKVIRQAASQKTVTNAEPAIIDVIGFMDRKTENEKKRRGKKMIPEGMSPVYYFANGAKRTMFVPDAAARAVHGLGKAEMGIVARTARRTQGALRLGATTANMAFVLPNLVIDVGRLAVTSKAGINTPVDFVRLPLQLIANIGHRTFRTETYTKFLESGAANSNFQAYVESFGKTSTVTAPTLFSTPAGPGRLASRSPVENFTHTLGTPASILEEAVKMTGFRRLLNQLKEQGIDPNKDSTAMRALVEEVRNHVGSPDFMRKGDQVIGGLLFMFFNARIQGVAADVGRFAGADGWKTGGAAWMRMTALVGAPTVALMAYIMSDDDLLRDYLQVPERERQDNWLIPKPSTSPRITLEDGTTSRDFFKIPRRDSIGAFANFIESFMIYAAAEEPITATQIFGDTVAQFSPISFEGNGWGERLQSVLSQVNPIVKVPLELITGQNFYFHSDTIPSYMEGGNDKSQEFTDGTNEFYKKAASLVPDWGPDALKSPALLQHASRGFFAGMVEQFVGRKPLEGRSEATGYPIIGPVLGRFLRSRYSSSTGMNRILDESEAQQISDRNRDAHKADILVEEFKLHDKATIAKELRVIAKEDPVLLDAVERALKQEERGLGFADRRLKRLSVDRGIKAGAVEQILRQSSMTNELRDQFIAEKLKNDTISLEVKRQVRKLLKEKPIKGWEMK